MPWEAKNTIKEVRVIPADPLPPEENERRKEAALDCIWAALVRSRKRRGLLPEDFPEER